MNHRPAIPIATRRLAAGAGILLVLLSLPLLRARFVHEPLIGLDEAIYMDVADVMNRGGRLYVDVWDHKPPGIYLIYQGILSMDRSPEAVHLVAFLVACLNALWLFLITRRLLGWVPAIAASWLFSIYTAAFWANSANTEGFLLVLELPALALFLVEMEQPGSRWRMALAGSLIGAAFVIKYVVLFPTVAALGWLLYRRWRRRGWRQAAAVAGSFGAGFLAAPVAVAVYCLHEGITEAFLNSNVGYNVGYVLHDAWSLFVQYGSTFLGAYAREQWPLLLLALTGILWWSLAVRNRSESRQANPAMILVLLWLLGSVIATLAPLKFLDHYYLLSIPGLCLAAVIPLSGPMIRRQRWLATGVVITLLAATLPTAVTATEQSMAALSQPSVPVDQSQYPPAVIGRYLREHTEPGDRIYVWRSFATDIYFYARRNPASRYFFWPHLLRTPRPPHMEANFSADMAHHPPLYVVVGHSDVYADIHLPRMERFIRDRCVPETTIGDVTLYRRVSP